MQWTQVSALLYLIVISRCTGVLSKIHSSSDAMAEHERRCSDMSYWDYDMERRVHCFIACEEDSGLRSECIHYCQGITHGSLFSGDKCHLDVHNCTKKSLADGQMTCCILLSQILILNKISFSVSNDPFP